MYTYFLPKTSSDCVVETILLSGSASGYGCFFIKVKLDDPSSKNLLSDIQAWSSENNISLEASAPGVLKVTDLYNVVSLGEMLVTKGYIRGDDETNYITLKQEAQKFREQRNRLTDSTISSHPEISLSTAEKEVDKLIAATENSTVVAKLIAAVLAPSLDKYNVELFELMLTHNVDPSIMDSIELLWKISHGQAPLEETHSSLAQPSSYSYVQREIILGFAISKLLTKFSNLSDQEKLYIIIGILLFRNGEQELSPLHEIRSIIEGSLSGQAVPTSLNKYFNDSSIMSLTIEAIGFMGVVVKGYVASFERLEALQCSTKSEGLMAYIREKRALMEMLANSDLSNARWTRYKVEFKASIPNLRTPTSLDGDSASSRVQKQSRPWYQTTPIKAPNNRAQAAPSFGLSQHPDTAFGRTKHVGGAFGQPQHFGTSFGRPQNPSVSPMTLADHLFERQAPEVQYKPAMELIESALADMGCFYKNMEIHCGRSGIRDTEFTYKITLYAPSSENEIEEKLKTAFIVALTKVTASLGEITCNSESVDGSDDVQLSKAAYKITCHHNALQLFKLELDFVLPNGVCNNPENGWKMQRDTAGRPASVINSVAALPHSIAPFNFSSTASSHATTERTAPAFVTVSFPPVTVSTSSAVPAHRAPGPQSGGVFTNSRENRIALNREKLLQKARSLVQAANQQKFLTALEEGKYSLALRLACSDGRLDLVELLVTNKEEADLNIDFNQASSNGKTALDWAMESKSENAEKLVTLLKTHGAKSQNERALSA